MKVKLLTSLKVDDGRIMTPGVYDDAGGSFPYKLYNEIEYHRKTGRKTLEILEENKPKSSPTTIKESSSTKKTTAKDEEINTADSGEEDITTTSSSKTSSSRKKGRRTSSSNT